MEAVQTRTTEPPNDKDKLPGRLQRCCVSKTRDAGPVNFIGWFGLGNLECPRFFV